MRYTIRKTHWNVSQKDWEDKAEDGMGAVTAAMILFSALMVVALVW